jgi:MoaA/NifB/PqqE/SkfB family radical SAM enzyme
VSNNALDLGSITTYKELNDDQMKKIVEFLISLDEKYNLFNLKYEKIHNDFFEEIINQKNEKLNKHLKQISQIVDHVNSLVKFNDDDDDKSVCLGVLFIKVYQYLNQCKKIKYHVFLSKFSRVRRGSW